MEQKQLFDDLLELLHNKLTILHDKREENAQNTLKALWHNASGYPVSPINAEKLKLPILTLLQISILEESIKNRLLGLPLAHMTERQHFMDMDFIVSKGLYIPRKETELLAQEAIDVIQNEFSYVPKVNVFDLCTGIGTVALAIAYHCQNTLVFGSDIYEPAIDAAHVNAQHFNLQERTEFYKADMFDRFEALALKNKTNIIVSAPPYISSVKVKQLTSEIADHEPREAFDAGPFGVSIFNKLISEAPEYLSANGYLIFECGLGQGDFLANQLSKNRNYDQVSKICDEYGNVRVLKAKKAS